MANYSHFLKLYRTLLIDARFGKIIADPVRVEFFQGSRAYTVLNRLVPPIIPTGREFTLSAPQQMTIKGDGTFIELTARVEETFGKRQYCEDQSTE